MREFPITGPFVEQATNALGSVPLFNSLAPDALQKVVSVATMNQFDPGEAVVTAGDLSDSFHVVVNGAASVRVSREDGRSTTEVATLGRSECIGEMGLIMGSPRTATVAASSKLFTLKFSSEAFRAMFEQVPGFGWAICSALAVRLRETSKKLPYTYNADRPDAETLSLLPFEFIHRHRLLPLKVEGNKLTVGFVDEPTSQAMSGIRQLLPSMDVKPVHINSGFYNDTLSTGAAVKEWTEPDAPASQAADPGAGQAQAEAGGGGGGVGEFPNAQVDAPTQASSPRLDAILKRMVAEGASDLHLTAGLRPRWRVDGEMRELADAAPLGDRTVYDLMHPIMRSSDRREFVESNDLDFAYGIPNTARFRVNVFRDRTGVGAVLRLIPDKILTAEQLGLPQTVLRLSNIPKGLVVVTGPTGSGKSTTLAAMLDYINKSRAEHVITMEDPIEFVHQSRKCLFNQREIGPHSDSFHAALKAALRQDPDIVLVGEMRDRETIELALETANTGHLVFGTLHTATAVSTVERIVNVFPSDQMDQVRSTLAECLKGVIAQCLLKKRGGRAHRSAGDPGLHPGGDQPHPPGQVISDRIGHGDGRKAGKHLAERRVGQARRVEPGGLRGGPVQDPGQARPGPALRAAVRKRVEFRHAPSLPDLRTGRRLHRPAWGAGRGRSQRRGRSGRRRGRRTPPQRRGG